MAYGSLAAGQTTRSNPKVDYLPCNNEKILKGSVCCVNASGFITTATSSNYSGNAPFVCVVTTDNSAGTAGAIPVPVVGEGQFVTVITDSALFPGQSVKVSSTNAGHVTAFVAGTDSEDLKVGYFTRIEGGIITKNSTTPYTEQFTDAADYNVGNAIIGQVIEIWLGR